MGRVQSESVDLEHLGGLIRRMVRLSFVGLGLLTVATVSVALIARPSGYWWRENLLPWVEPVATTIGAIATVVGVGAAVVAGRYAAGAYEREGVREQALAEQIGQVEDERRRDQATRVAAWVEHREVGDGKGGRAWSHHVTVLNGSAQPVYEIFAILRDGAGTYSMVKSKPVLPPHESWQELLGTHSAPYMVELRFRDVANRHWYRDGDGVLATGAAAW